MDRIKKFTVNGVTYDSLDAMPKDVREQFQAAMAVLKDENGDGVPDILQEPTRSQVEVEQSVTINGKRYDRTEDVPEAFRALLGKVSGLADNPPPTRRAPSPPPIASGGVVLDPSDQPRRYPWSLILALVVILGGVVGLWASGISPGEFLHKLGK